MNKNKWDLLQLFAGEGASASGSGEGSGNSSDPGVDSVAAEHQRLRELGVPEDKLRKRAQRQSARLPKSATVSTPSQAQQPSQEQVATAKTGTPAEETETKTEAKPEATKRMTWDEIMADPEYNREMQATVQARLRSAKKAEETLGKLDPIIGILAARHNLDLNNLDYDKLVAAVKEDDAYYEDIALEWGESVPKVKREVQEKTEAAAQQRAETRTLEEQRFQEHISRLERQGEEMKKTFPDFDLRTELKNPTFARMTSIGLSVEDAYYAVHRKDITEAQRQAAAAQTAQQISYAIQNNSRRPDENGTTGSAPSVTTFDYSKASRGEREALKAKIRAAAARGEKLYPGR